MNNKIIVAVTLTLMSLAFLCSSVVFFLGRIIPEEYTGPQSNNQLFYKVENCHLSNNFLTISGWAIRKGVAMSDKTITILIPTTDGLKEYKTILTVRGDASTIANKAFSDNLNYTNSGFKAYAFVDKEEITGKAYIKLNSKGESWMSLTECGI
ncbi:hypothetical protein HmCmsJML116_03890 [Escherichia coli]|uniref:hypothetical protein n=1 Tax=Escherichia coli TaxID=562 RepID=UPI000BA969F7|nr:hypothetical protein [Escherichia coli]MCV5818539.1 hypothetical protein [Escherichia coli]PAQ59761.1 hypothetical protein BIZ41_20825 [Escherichia coli]GCW61958.1 hypothetical protein HmCmsJML116_03890 [Escherichia coli]GCZ63240.1 hypothetical protein HmCmsJML136_02852 [Escherichia coli]